jgi:hypothetical protein
MDLANKTQYQNLTDKLATLWIDHSLIDENGKGICNIACLKEKEGWKIDPFLSIPTAIEYTNWNLDIIVKGLNDYKKIKGFYPKSIKDIKDIDYDMNFGEMFYDTSSSVFKYFNNADNFILWSNGPDRDNDKALKQYDPEKTNFKEGKIADGDIVRYSSKEFYDEYKKNSKK